MKEDRLDGDLSAEARGSPGDTPDKLPEDARIKLTQAIAQMRDETKPFADSEVVRELGEIAKGIAAKG